MNHLVSGLTATHFAKTDDVNSSLELRLLLPRKVKKAQRYLTAAIAYPNQHISAPPKYGFGKQHLAGDQATSASLQRTNSDQLRAIFVAQW
jgi:hypothetical protein